MGLVQKRGDERAKFNLAPGGLICRCRKITPLWWRKAWLLSWQPISVFFRFCELTQPHNPICLRPLLRRRRCGFVAVQARIQTSRSPSLVGTTGIVLRVYRGRRAVWRRGQDPTHEMRPLGSALTSFRDRSEGRPDASEANSARPILVRGQPRHVLFRIRLRRVLGSSFGEHETAVHRA